MGVDVLRAAGGMTGRGGGGLAFETSNNSVDILGRTGRGALALGDRAGERRTTWPELTRTGLLETVVKVNRKPGSRTGTKRRRTD